MRRRAFRLLMSDRDRLLIHRLGAALDRVARPHARGEPLPMAVQASLWQLGVPCTDVTPREVVIARLWSLKRVITQVQLNETQAGGRPPSAA
jgi:hypothetical protein